MSTEKPVGLIKKDIYVAENSSVWGNFLIFDAAEVKTRIT